MIVYMLDVREDVYSEINDITHDIDDYDRDEMSQEQVEIFH
jgi:hypothetical protein